MSRYKYTARILFDSVNLFMNKITEPPQPKGKCPRRNGFFSHPEPHVCNIFYNCIDGEAVEIICTTGLHFDEYSGTCVWPDSAGRQVSTPKSTNKIENLIISYLCIIIINI